MSGVVDPWQPVTSVPLDEYRRQMQGWQPMAKADAWVGTGVEAKEDFRRSILPPADPRLDNPVGTERIGQPQLTMPTPGIDPVVTQVGDVPITASHLDALRTMSAAVRAGAFGATSGLPEAGEAQAMIRAFHGSPHFFDRFDLGKIGTGEGAQAYGHGLYFAENEAIARHYRDNLSMQGNPVAANANMMLEMHGRDRAAALAAADRWAKTPGVDPEFAAAVRQAIEKPPGHMYEVGIKADPEHFLDWDAPLSKQSEHVQQALAKAGVKAGWIPAADKPGLLTRHGPGGVDATIEKLSDKYGTQWKLKYDTAQGHGFATFPTMEQAQHWLENKSPTRGSEIYKTLTGSGIADHAASAKLREAGIPGIRYLDATSRRIPAMDAEAIADGERRVAALAAELKAAEAAQKTAARGTPAHNDAALSAINARSQLETETAHLDKLRASAKTPKRNLVVFDDSLIEVLRKYGLAGLIAGGPAAAVATNPTAAEQGSPTP